MSIRGLEGLSTESINYELENGAKFIRYQYCISILVMTFKRSSDVYFIRCDENRVVRGLLYSVISFIFGWWGFPWGPIYTVGSFITNFAGGNDITQEIIRASNTSNSE